MYTFYQNLSFNDLKQKKTKTSQQIDTFGVEEQNEGFTENLNK